MVSCILIKLKHLTPLHIGNGRENYDFAASSLQSDTISAALAAMKAQTKNSGNLRDFMDSFIVSSAFPYIGNRYFLPKPMGRIDLEITDEDEYVARKKIKKISFVERKLWEELITGKKLRIKESQLQGCFLLADGGDEYQDPPYRTQVNQRVKVPLDGRADAEPFFFEWTFFHEDAGLYCLLQAPVNIQNELVTLFRLLGECGIGTDKSVGGGKFEVESGIVSLPVVSEANATMLLSLYTPTGTEVPQLHLPESCYELILRGGYIAGSSYPDFMHLRKKSVYMFNVGSVFHTSFELKGKIVDLRPEWNDELLHPVFRSGKPFTVSIKRPQL